MSYVTIQFKGNIMKLVILLFVFVLVSGCQGDKNDDVNTHFSQFIADLWLEGGEVIKILWRDCSKKLVEVKDIIDHKEYFPKFLRCMKRKTLRALDRTLSTDVVPVFEGINLVRYELVDKAGHTMVINNDTSSWSEKEMEEADWRTLALQRMAKVLRTHVIKFDFDELQAEEKATAEYRGRRRHHMMTMMMFGIVSIGMVLIPMGFQFLAVLGGKAFLLAKFALILASIQGLKKVDHSYEGYPYHERGKIAASPLNYGFYHSYLPYDHYEKRSEDNWPLPSALPRTVPPSMPLNNPWPDRSVSTSKVDRIHLRDDKKQAKESKKVEIGSWKPEKPRALRQESEPRLYPVYSPSYTSIDAPSPLTDLTTAPGQVQADYSLELPYNGFHFQSPTTVVSA